MHFLDNIIGYTCYSGYRPNSIISEADDVFPNLTFSFVQCTTIKNHIKTPYHIFVFFILHKLIIKKKLFNFKKLFEVFIAILLDKGAMVINEPNNV